MCYLNCFNYMYCPKEINIMKRMKQIPFDLLYRGLLDVKIVVRVDIHSRLAVCQSNYQAMPVAHWYFTLLGQGHSQSQSFDLWTTKVHFMADL